MNQEKIIQAIADVINKKGTDDFGMLPWCKPSDLIAELAAAIAPHLEAGAGTTTEQLREQFEATGYTSWINSEIYPDGRIYTKEYTEWLEKKVLRNVPEPKDYPYELFDHMANEHGLTLTNTELGDIIHVARGAGTKTGWEDAPSWAEWRTVDKGGAITFWDKEPRLSHAGYWTMQGTDGTKWEEVGQDESWKHSLQSRPR